MNAEILTSGDLKSGDFFRTSPPPPPHRIRQCDDLPPTSGKDPYPPPSRYRAISREKRGFICQGLQFAEYSSNQTLAYIGVTKKKVCYI